MYKCKMCGEEYSKGDIRELKMIGEDFNRSPFICPDCWDNFQRLDVDKRAEMLINDFKEENEV